LTDFVVTITDQAALDGITWAREQYNASLPQPPAPPDTVMGGRTTMPEGMAPMPMAEVPPPLATDQEYVQWVMEQAAISYADQKLRAEYQAHYENAAGGATRSGRR
jgi:hypothetical protein